MSIFGDIEHGVDKVADDAGDAVEDAAVPGSRQIGSNPLGSKAGETPLGLEIRAQQAGRLPGAEGAVTADEEAEIEAIEAAGGDE